MKKLYVNEDACIGCGACVSIDPEHFDFNDEGLSNIISNENIESEDVVNAIESCPTNAIKYVESEKEECECDNSCGGCSSCDCHK